MQRIYLFPMFAACCSVALAQSATTETQRDVDQQQRIEQGLKSGELSTRESANLEHQEQRVDRTQARDMRDGSLSAGDKAQIQREQNRVSTDVYRDKHNGVVGNPDSASSQRMQNDVQRNVDQQQRINAGVRSGQLSAQQTATLEHGQARTDRGEAIAGANGHVGAREQAHIQGRDDRQSGRIYRKKHDPITQP